jgi:hypothetical protein
MKRIYYYLAIICLFIGASSCGYDNYDEPSSMFKGKITYNGETIYMGYGEVYFQLWEYPQKYGGNVQNDVPISQNGEFGIIMFDGTYKLIFPQNQGPFRMKPDAETNDTIFIALKGNKEYDVEVLPYYMFDGDVQYSYDKPTGLMDVSVKLKKIITDANQRSVEYVRVLYNATQFVGNTGDYYLGYKTVGWPADVTNINLNLEPKERPTQNPGQDYLYFRVGVKIQNVEDLLYSQVVKINL